MKLSVWALAAAMLVASSSALAGQVSLAWDPVPDLGLAGYKIYRSATPGGPYTVAGYADSCQAVSWTSPEWPGGTYYLVATAYNTLGQESGYSNEVMRVAAPDVAPGIPQHLRWEDL